MTAMEVRCSDLLEENPIWGAQLTDSPSCCLFTSITTFLPRLFPVNDWGIVLVLVHFCLMQDSSNVQVLLRDSPMVWPKFLQNCVTESLSAQSIASLPSQVVKLSSECEGFCLPIPTPSSFVKGISPNKFLVQLILFLCQPLEDQSNKWWGFYTTINGSF